MWAYLIDPRAINTIEDCKRQGDRAVAAIRQCESMITRLRAYHLSLCDRAREIVCAPYHIEIEFRRERSYSDNRVQYIAEIFRVYDVKGISRQSIRREIWPGKERHKAMKAFTEIERAYPGAPITRKLETSRHRIMNMRTNAAVLSRSYGHSNSEAETPGSGRPCRLAAAR